MFSPHRLCRTFQHHHPPPLSPKKAKRVARGIRQQEGGRGGRWVGPPPSTCLGVFSPPHCDKLEMGLCMVTLPVSHSSISSVQVIEEEEEEEGGEEQLNREQETHEKWKE